MEGERQRLDKEMKNSHIEIVRINEVLRNEQKKHTDTRENYQHLRNSSHQTTRELERKITEVDDLTKKKDLLIELKDKAEQDIKQKDQVISNQKNEITKQEG